ncbi:Na(+)-translocating NADH-quinone reductase subunit F [Winogradskyella bathintestinalis]|uniref:Na(+)-translocating NADH-quinone reductase subunit F n=1 Tax=Winogradskyella bathintestinalis TaxID=3035208 RepID=A0ABT7ZV77_9FLAO|nr:Na(+)-translocating NADH-quinone reductase subunit F [Winogradskyella bathintestinalis]MDN3492931.1 Na(+)-translocating NADH-quinone reductase subunit F [Winogradskyella bathintestinalis]
MKTSFRFESAINKLYTAFHNKTLNPDDCKQCAVGNILDNKDNWKHLTDFHGSTQLNYVGLVHQNLGRRFNGYTPVELLQIERAFLIGCGYDLTTHKPLFKPETLDDSDLFNGLCEVVALLCGLDGIRDIMDCSVLFGFEKRTLEPQY